MREYTLQQALDRLDEINAQLKINNNNLELWAEHYAITNAIKTVRPDTKTFPPIKIT